jgi:hypothetical protein
MSLLACSALLLACRKDAPTTASSTVSSSPREVMVDGAYHAVKCGDVTALWSGEAEGPRDDVPPRPKTYGVTALSFRLADGSTRPFEAKGELFFSDWSFDVFSPDCSTVALLQDHYGPYTLVATKELASMKGVDVAAPPVGETASVHAQWRWTGSSEFEFVASCCGGATVRRGKVSSPMTLQTIFEAASAPSGVRPTSTGWEIVK